MDSSPAILSRLITGWLVLTILSIRLSVSAGELLATARRYGLMLRAIAANIVLVPVLAASWPLSFWAWWWTSWRSFTPGGPPDLLP